MELKVFASVWSHKLPSFSFCSFWKKKKRFPWFMCSYLLEGLCAWCHSGTSAAQMGCLVRSFFCFFFNHSPGAATAPGPPGLMKSCRRSIWQLLIWHGASVPRHIPTTTTLLIPSAPLKQGKLPGGESIIALAQSATFNVRAQMENVHSTTRTQWCTDLLSHPPCFEKVGKEFSAHPFIVIINHPRACWKIIYCTCKWLTTQK